MADDQQPKGGARPVIIILLVAAVLVIAFAVFGRRSGEGQKEVSSTGHSITLVSA